MKPLANIALSIFLSVVAASCNTPKPTASTPPAPQSCNCPTDIMCTEDFRFVTVRVHDRSGNPAKLDRYETVRAANGSLLKRVDETDMGAGMYIIATDAEREQIGSCAGGEKFFFRGYVGEKRVVDEAYTLRNDCCHIKRESGREEIEL